MNLLDYFGLVSLVGGREGSHRTLVLRLPPSAFVSQSKVAQCTLSKGWLGSFGFRGRKRPKIANGERQIDGRGTKKRIKCKN